MADESIEALCKRAFNIINRTVFGGEITEARFRLDSTCKQPMQWIASQGHVSIGPEMRSQSLLGFKIALLHEMIHILNDERGVLDISVNSYHNKIFAKAATDAGLFVIRHRNRGWSLLSLLLPSNISDRRSCKTPSAESHGRLLCALESVSLTRGAWNGIVAILRRTNPGGRQSRTFLHKYVCGCPVPHNSVRCGRRPDGPNPPDIICNRCGQNFVGVI